jgi:hypothetical protein
LAFTFLQVELLRLRFFEHPDLLVEEDREQCLLHDEFTLKWRYVPRGLETSMYMNSEKTLVSSAAEQTCPLKM